MISAPCGCSRSRGETGTLTLTRCAEHPALSDSPFAGPPDPIMQFFAYEHLKPEQRAVSAPFCELAKSLVDPDGEAWLPRNAERSVALRKLLEAKDAAVRASIAR